MFEHLSYLLENSSVGLGMCGMHYNFHTRTEAVNMYTMIYVTAKPETPCSKNMHKNASMISTFCIGYQLPLVSQSPLYSPMPHGL